MNTVKFERATDARNRQVPGLYRRGEVWYCMMRVHGSPKMVRLSEPDQEMTLPAAIKAMQDKKADNRRGLLPKPVGEGITVAEAVKMYNTYHTETKGGKAESTRLGEEVGMEVIERTLGPGYNLAALDAGKIKDFVAERRKGGLRAAQLAQVHLRNLLKHCIELGKIKEMPSGWVVLKYRAPRKRLLTPEEIESFCNRAIEELPHQGQTVSDYVRFLASTGAREQEGLRVKWDEVSLERRQVHLTVKGGARVVVDFNPKLEALLLEMKDRAKGPFLFCHYRDAETQIKTLRQSFERLMEKEENRWTLHYLRHYFISRCVMSGVDYMTIAQWVGHKDGGILIGKVYGHLNDAHTKQMASKVSL